MNRLRTTGGIRRVRHCAIAIIALALGLVATTASAQNPFLIDGIVPANGSPGGVDPVQVNDPFGGAQELGAANQSTAKLGSINTDALATLDFTNPNGQVDLRRIWTQTAKATNGHLWFYFAWERDANSGSGFIAYEFQQSALSPSCVYTGAIDLVKPQTAGETALINGCNPWAGRQAGDFMILWDQQGSALTITKRVFNGTSFGPAIALGTAVPAISADGFKGEAAIDLTTDVFPAGGACVSFANIIPGTVTGNSDSADYKDTVLSTFEPVSNCGGVKVVKVTVPAAQSGTFPYTLARLDGSDVKFGGISQLTGTLTVDGDHDDYDLVKEGTNFTLSEGTQTSPWELTSIVCAVAGGTPTGDIKAGGTFTVEASKLTTCTITNSRRRGSITVIKHVINNNGGTAVAADFSMSLQDTGPTTTPFGGHESPGDTYTFDEGHAFNVTETGPTSSYTASFSSDCSGQIVAGVTKVCTVTNNDNAPSLTLNKIVIKDNGGTALESAWTLTANGGTAGTLSGPGAAGSTDVVSDSTFKAGTYALSESGPSGYTASAWTCTGGTQNGSSITLALGQSATCTITNDDAKAAPTLSTVQRAILRDSLTAQGIVVGDGNGGALTATFKVYSDTNCSTQVGSDETVNVSLNGTTGTATTINGVQVTASGTYKWRVTFSGNLYNDAVTTTCGSEISVVTFTQ